MDRQATIMLQEDQGPQILLVGNPNVGKSVLFNLLTGTYVNVSNYPGTTVEVFRGRLKGPLSWVVIDTPGVNSLLPRSEDERVTRDILWAEGQKVVLQVADAKNLPRALQITTQLAEMGIPMVLCLNMQDEAAQQGLEVDAQRLAQLTGVAVVPTVAVERRGLARLLASVNDPRPCRLQVPLGSTLERAIAEIEPLLPENLPWARRAVAIALLSGDEDLLAWLSQRMGAPSFREIRKALHRAQEHFAEPLSYVISKARQDFVQEVAQQVTRRMAAPRPRWAEKLGRACMHPFWGMFILIGVLVLLYEVVGRFAAGTCVGWLEGSLFGTSVRSAGEATGILNPFLERVLAAVLPWPMAVDFFVGPYGMITMGLTYSIAIVLPIVFFFFICFGFLEDSGYLPRLTILADRAFKRMGLNGKAVLPMILGLGCDTMATLTTRILETPKQRLIATLLLALGVPCSAQLGVILAMASALGWPALLGIGGVVGSQLLLVGYLAGKLLPGEKADFIIEIPPLRWPQIGNIARKTLQRTEWFLKEAVPLFLLGTLVLWGLDHLGWLDRLQRLARPLVVHVLGLPQEAANAFLIGFLRRDYGAAGLMQLQQSGAMDGLQTVVSLITITLFVPCLANFLIMVKEQGWKRAFAMVGFIVPFAFAVGGVVNLCLRTLHLHF